MIVIDTSEWGEFRISDLFSTITRAKRRTLNAYSSGATPYVTNSSFNNGITDFLQPKSADDIERGGCITVNTVDGSAFWQAHDFLANSSGNGLLLLRREDLNECRALFLCAALRASLEASFAVMLTKDVVRNITIKLPVTTTGDPNWDYMESVMGDQLTQQEAKLDALSSISSTLPIEDV